MQNGFSPARQTSFNKTSKLHITDPMRRWPSGHRWFHLTTAEIVSIWWRRHERKASPCHSVFIYFVIYPFLVQWALSRAFASKLEMIVYRQAMKTVPRRSTSHSVLVTRYSRWSLNNMADNSYTTFSNVFFRMERICNLFPKIRTATYQHCCR